MDKLYLQIMVHVTETSVFVNDYVSSLIIMMIVLVNIELLF